MFCSKCGQQNEDNNFKFTRCGFVLHAPPVQVVSDTKTMGGLIPYKNPMALWSYYLGVFSLIPVLGIPLGIGALITGFRGLKFAGLHPEAKGKVHAWIGIVLGAIGAVGYALLILLVMAR